MSGSQSYGPSAAAHQVEGGFFTWFRSMRENHFVHPWTRHYSHRIMLVVYAVLVTYEGLRLLVDVSGGVAAGVELAWVAILMYVQAAILLHDRGRLCEKCIGEMPLDGSAEAERHRRSLSAAHWLEDRRFVVGGVWLGLLVYQYLFVGSFVATLTSAATLLGFSLVSSRHWRLELWCPACGTDDDGGEDDETDAPDSGPRSGLALKI